MKTLTYEERAELYKELREIAMKYGVSIIVSQPRKWTTFVRDPDPSAELRGPIFIDYLSDFPRKTKI